MSPAHKYFRLWTDRDLVQYGACRNEDCDCGKGRSFLAKERLLIGGFTSHLDHRARFALGRTFAGDGEEIAAGKSERRGRRDITEGMASAEHAARRRLDSPRPKSVEARRLSVMKVASVVEFALVSAADPPVSLKPSIGHRIRRRH
ncbi:hypothetical protein [Mesorhizobium sp. M1342]|uniref:hypothetical protein n=1 Tax=Mesorhizobium sp. M1342 TaxID=2957088 RepID=UPI003336CA11